MNPPRIPVGTHGPAYELAPLPFTLLCFTVLCVLAAHAPHMPAWYTAVLAAIVAARWRQRRRTTRSGHVIKRRRAERVKVVAGDRQADLHR